MGKVMNRTINLAYGRTGLLVDFPAACTTVLEPAFVDGLSDQQEAIRSALRHPIGTDPLRSLVSAEQTVAISAVSYTHLTLPTKA